MRFDWDDGNREHVAEHDVTTDEVEYALVHDPLDIEVEIRDGEERLVQIGAAASGRILTVISTLREGHVRVVTAFNATERRRREFELSRLERYGTQN
jgi:uncharacterized DUF497 family protein